MEEFLQSEVDDGQRWFMAVLPKSSGCITPLFIVPGAARSVSVANGRPDLRWRSTPTMAAFVLSKSGFGGCCDTGDQRPGPSEMR